MAERAHERRRIAPTAVAVAAFVAVFALACATTPGLMQLEWRDGRLFGAGVDVLRRAAPIGLAALGMALVIGTRGVDLSVGAVCALAAVGSALALRDHGLGAGAASAIVLAGGALLGAFNGALVAWLGLQPIVATLILFTAGRGLAQLASEGTVVAFDSPSFAALAGSALLGLPVPVWIVACATCSLSVVSRRTAFGLYARAVGDNPRAARLAGLPVSAVLVGAYALCAVCAAAAGLLVASDVRAGDPASAGLYLELDAILACVIGGTPLSGGRVRALGALLGALTLQTLTTVFAMHGAPLHWALVAKAIAVLTVCAVQSPKLRELVGGGGR